MRLRTTNAHKACAPLLTNCGLSLRAVIGQSALLETKNVDPRPLQSFGSMKRRHSDPTTRGWSTTDASEDKLGEKMLKREVCVMLLEPLDSYNDLPHPVG